MEKQTLGKEGVCEMYTQNKTKQNLQVQKTGLLGFSISSNCSPIWDSKLLFKNNIFLL